MKLEEAHIKSIKSSFEKMKDKEDLLQLLNFVKPLVYGEKTIPFKLKQLTWYANSTLKGRRYKEFNIKKKSGEHRTINSPVSGLKAIQRILNFILQCVYEPHKAAMGFVNGKSIVDNARLHTGNHYVYNIDLKDFFPSIEAGRIWSRFQHPPFNLNDRTNRKELANIITWLCCCEMEVERLDEKNQWHIVKRNVLPQGAPTSPTISNIVCHQLDFYLSAVAKRFGLKYSRYADDITYSSMHNVYQKGSEFLSEVHRIISAQSFHINVNKTRLQKAGYRQEVTGLLVNENVNLQTRYIKQLRMWLYYWERYGYERASGFFLQQYVADKGHVKNGKPDLANVISGKLDYLKMVKGSENDLYLKLKNRFNQLTTKTIDQIDLSKVKKISKPSERESIIEENIDINNNNSYPILHNPQKTITLLKSFSVNEKDLKYSTHSWEEGKYNSYEEYIEKIRIEWNEIKDELKNQSPRLFAKISNFLFNNKLGQKNEEGYYISWGEKRLKFGWSSANLKDHMSDPGNSPFSCPIPDQIRELDKRHDLLYFKDYADVFKNEIEFREDSNNFKKMILELWEKELSYDFNIKGVEQFAGFSFFTDVHLVKESLRTVFRDMYKVKPQFPTIIIEKISSFNERGYHLIKVTQKDSFITRDVNDPKLTSPSGNLFSIIRNLKNLSDYSIVSRFRDGRNYRLNYLTSTKTDFIETLTQDENTLGFSHEFKFYL
ncbi:MAG: RNA-directed DNA polymerase [Flavobacteriales bacterium]|nr:RNA-directed DNA polymerase [Flavobacteriales bacterium]